MKETKSQSTSRKQQLISAIRDNNREQFADLLTPDYVDNAKHVLGSIMDTAIDEEAGWAAAALLEAGLNKPEKYAEKAARKQTAGVLLAMTQYDVELDQALLILLQNESTNRAETILQQPETTFRHGFEKNKIASAFLEYRPLQIKEFLANGGFAECAFFEDVNEEPGSIAHTILAKGMKRGTTAQLKALLYDYTDEPRECFLNLARHTSRWLSNGRWWEEPVSNQTDAERTAMMRQYFSTILQKTISLSGDQVERYRNARLLCLIYNDPDPSTVQADIRAGANAFGNAAASHASMKYTPIAALMTETTEETICDILPVIMEENGDEAEQYGRRDIPDLFELVTRRKNYRALHELLQYDQFDPDVRKLVNQMIRQDDPDRAVKLLESGAVNSTDVDSNATSNADLFAEQPDALFELFDYLDEDRQADLLRELARRGNDTLLGRFVDSDKPGQGMKLRAARQAWLNRNQTCVQRVIDDQGKGRVMEYISQPGHSGYATTIEGGGGIVEHQLHVIETFAERFGLPADSEAQDDLLLNIVQLGLQGNDRDWREQAELSSVQTLKNLQGTHDLNPASLEQAYRAIDRKGKVYEELFRLLVRWQPPPSSMIEDLQTAYRTILREELTERQRKKLRADGIEL